MPPWLALQTNTSFSRCTIKMYAKYNMIAPITVLPLQHDFRIEHQQLFRWRQSISMVNMRLLLVVKTTESSLCQTYEYRTSPATIDLRKRYFIFFICLDTTITCLKLSKNRCLHKYISSKQLTFFTLRIAKCRFQQRYNFVNKFTCCHSAVRNISFFDNRVR